MITKLLRQNIIIICFLTCLLLCSCGKDNTVVIANMNLMSYMKQLNGVWVNKGNDSSAYSNVIFSINDLNTFTIEIKDQNGISIKENIDDIVANDDALKTYSVYISGEVKYVFYMIDSNNIVFQGCEMELIDEYFNTEFARIEGAWTNENGVKVTFFTNKNTRYVNLTDGFGTFNKRIFDIAVATDAESGNYIMTKEGSSFINFYYDLNDDGSLKFYDYTLYRNEDTTDYDSLQTEEITEIDEEQETPAYDLSTHGNNTGYEVQDYSGDIPTDIGYIFVGDSRFVGMDSACRVSSKSNQFVVAKISQGYHWLKNEAMPQIDNIISNHSASGWVVIFNLGINDLANINNYKSFYSGLAAKPYKVVLVSVNPVGNYPSIPNETVEGFNNSLKGLGYTYIDTYSYLMNERGYVTPDGLHYSNSTYQDIYKYIIYSVKGIQLSEADRAAIENQYHGTTANVVSDNSASNNAVSSNTTVPNTASNGYSFANIEEFYSNEVNSVDFSNRIQNMKTSSNAVFSNITVNLSGNTIIYNYVYAIDTPEVDWDANDRILETNSVQEMLKLHQDSGVTSTITIGYIYYDKNGTAIHSYYNEG